MFTQIKTSKENKEIVSNLTRKLGLGAENIIARMAFSHSLSQNRKLNIKDIKDSSGKEYSKSVLFGEYFDLYIGMLCVHYGLYKTDKDIGRYVKMHIDDGLQLLNEEISKRNNVDGFDYMTEKLSEKISKLT